MRHRIAALAAFALLGTASVAGADDTLNVGDKSPQLTVKEFVKGEPVKSFEKGKVYVVEFWATWCGPCKVSIPHLTEIQKKNKDVKIIGVSILEENQALVVPFVKQMGDKMDYTVAMDSVPNGKDGDEGFMAKNWLIAAGEGGIPSAFIVDKDTKIAWIGHPSELEEPLKKVVDGSYDLKAAVKARTEAKAEEKRMEAFNQKLGEAQKSGPMAFVKAIDEIVAQEPKMESKLASYKFIALLSKDGDPAKAAKLGSKMVSETFKNDPDGLNNIAWSIVDPAAGKRSPELVKVALDAATLADKLTQSKNGAVADTLAKAQFDSGDVAKAIETQARAIKVSEEAKEVEGLAEMKERLAQYRKSAKK